MQGRIGTSRAVKCCLLPIIAISLGGCLEKRESASVASVSNPETQQDHELTGSVGDGPIVGASMRIRANDGTTVATLESDANAGYNITVRTKGKFYPLTIDSQSGIDLVTNLGPDFDLYGAVIEPGKKSVANLNPFSTFAVELARNMNGGANKANLSAAENVVSKELNSGLASLAESGSMATQIDASNIAEILKASETLGETVRRVRDLQISTGRSGTGNSVVQSVAADLVDGVIDGRGGANVDARVAALTTVVSTQTLLESMQVELHVNGADATNVMESALNAVSRNGSDLSFEELTVTADMLDAARIGLDACLAVVPGPDLQELADAVALIQVGMTPMMIRSLVPDSYRETLDSAITSIANGTSADIETVNSVSRNGGGTVSASNAAPVISGAPPTTVEVDAMYTFTPTASDPDGDALTFTISGQPGWTTFDSTTGTLSGTPGAGSAGNHANIVIGVTDGEFTTELPGFAITVTTPTPANSPPTITGTPPISVEVGTNYSFLPTANDPDGDTLTFSIAGLPAWAAFDSTTGLLSGTPGAGSAGDYANIVIGVTDGEFTTELPAFAITVTSPTPANSPPTITGTPPTSVEVGTNYSFLPTANDPDGDSLTFSIAGLPAWAAFDSTTGSLSGTPAVGDENVYSNIMIGVSDGEFTDSLGPFSIDVLSSGTGTGSVTLNWTAPTQNEDGSTLTDLAGYTIYWGTTPGNYTDTTTINNPGITTFTVDGLAPGTYEFVATSLNAAGIESTYSNPATKTVP